MDGEVTVHQLDPSSEIPSQIFESDFYSLSRTPDEISVVCRSEIEVAAKKSVSGWRCIKVLGPLEFSLTGILAGIADVLARAGISIFAISTYDTDYILVRSENVDAAVQALSRAGYALDE